MAPRTSSSGDYVARSDDALAWRASSTTTLRSDFNSTPRPASNSARDLRSCAETEEEVLGADVVVTEGDRLAQRQLERLLAVRREGDVATDRHRRRLGLVEPRLDVGAGHAEVSQRLGGHALVVARQRMEQVLGADDRVVAPRATACASITAVRARSVKRWNLRDFSPSTRRPMSPPWRCCAAWRVTPPPRQLRP